MSGSSSDLSGCDSPYDTNELHSPIEEHYDVSGTSIQPEDAVDTSEQALVETTWGLRLRTRMDQLSNDLSGSLVLAPPQLHLTDLYLQGVVYFFRFMAFTTQALHFLWLLVGNVGRGVKRSFQEDIYIFFKGSSHPYYSNDVKLNQSGVPEIDWYYNAATNTFLTSRLYANSQTYHTHHIPFLTAEVKYNDLSLYDISDFINSVRWAGTDDPDGHQIEPMPNVDVLLSAWSLSSGIVLKRSDQMNLCVINTDGDETKIPLRNQA